MMKRTFSTITLATISHLVMSASEIQAASDIQTGYFIDSPVTGLYYQTSSSLDGFTDKGAFNYKDGDVVTFYLGTNKSALPIATLSGQEVVTPTLASATPSRSVNLTRLLLSLDSTPGNREEIILVSKALSDPQFQKKLRQINLQALDASKDKLGINLVSVQEAARHLDESQTYIEKNFTSEEVILRPLNTKFRNIIIKRRDWQGNLCFFDVARKSSPDYYGPIGSMTYMVTAEGIYEYPDIGDYFGSTDGSVSGCELNTKHRYTEVLFEPIEVFAEWGGLIGCAIQGCTRNDINGFTIEDYDDEIDWKYRTVAINYDPNTQLLMQKNQGLGPKENVSHLNRSESIWLTTRADANHHVDFDGIWQETTYLSDGNIDNQCLLVTGGKVLSAAPDDDECPTGIKAYANDVTASHGDMWWLEPANSKATLAQLNTAVKWYDTDTKPRYTSWEYLPAGENWEQGVLYRLQQHIVVDNKGIQHPQTHLISELKKYQNRESRT